MTIEQWIRVLIATLRDFRRNIYRTKTGVILTTRAEFEAHIEDWRS